ncbi:MAG: hypothetical protein HKN47_11815 [Pirellulaceae bacterium]|nr:hypothetical protein [Pirellulaceae bacterium]
MTENPYKPPAESTGVAELDVDKQFDVGRVGYRGGWLAIAAIGMISGGLTVAALFVGSGWLAEIINPFVLIGLFWFAALMSVMMMVHGVPLTTQTRFLYAICALPVGYLLYVPTCSITAMTLAGGNYNVNNTQASIASVVSFAAVLLVVSSVIRRIMQRRKSKAQLH